MLDLRSAMQAVALKRLTEHAVKTQSWPSVLTATALPMPAPIEPACPALPVEPAALKVNAATILRKDHTKRSRRRAISKLRAKKLKGK